MVVTYLMKFFNRLCYWKLIYFTRISALTMVEKEKGNSRLNMDLISFSRSFQ